MVLLMLLSTIVLSIDGNSAVVFFLFYIKKWQPTTNFPTSSTKFEAKLGSSFENSVFNIGTLQRNIAEFSSRKHQVRQLTFK